MSLNPWRRTTIAVGIALAGLTGCAHSVPLQSSGSIPAAEGKVKLSKGDNQNTKVKLEVEHLAEPGKVAPGASTYVVWIQQPQGDVQNVGALEVGDDKKAKLETVTPHEDFQVFITAEAMPTVAVPTSQRLMFANVRQ